MQVRVEPALILSGYSGSSGKSAGRGTILCGHIRPLPAAERRTYLKGWIREPRVQDTSLKQEGGRIVSVKSLVGSLSELGFASESAVHLIVDLPRKKIGDDSRTPKIILSEYECGYRFVRPPSDYKEVVFN
jgi:hypothetical protein